MKVRFYKDKQRQWRWRVVSRNGKILADSGEGYRRAVDAKRTLMSILNIGVDFERVEVQGYPIRTRA